MNTQNRLRIVFAFILLSTYAIAQNTDSGAQLPDNLRKIVLIRPTGKKLDDLPEMIVLPDTSRLHESAMQTIEQSFIHEAIDLYFLAQIYLKNKGVRTEIEPAYIALTKNQGGFAKFGFLLLNGGAHIDKSKTPYVDITEGNATAKPDRLTTPVMK
ncbi:MAG: hypothetical protein ACE5I1_04720 [bacterium]